MFSILEKIAKTLDDQSQFSETTTTGENPENTPVEDQGVEGEQLPPEEGMPEDEIAAEPMPQEQPTPEQIGAAAAQAFIGEDVMGAAMAGDPNAKDLIARTGGEVAGATAREAANAMQMQGPMEDVAAIPEEMPQEEIPYDEEAAAIPQVPAEEQIANQIVPASGGIVSAATGNQKVASQRNFESFVGELLSEKVAFNLDDLKAKANEAGSSVKASIGDLVQKAKSSKLNTSLDSGIQSAVDTFRNTASSGGGMLEKLKSFAGKVDKSLTSGIDKGVAHFMGTDKPMPAFDAEGLRTKIRSGYQNELKAMPADMKAALSTATGAKSYGDILSGAMSRPVKDTRAMVSEISQRKSFLNSLTPESRNALMRGTEGVNSTASALSAAISKPVSSIKSLIESVKKKDYNAVAKSGDIKGKLDSTFSGYKNNAAASVLSDLKNGTISPVRRTLGGDLANTYDKVKTNVGGYYDRNLREPAEAVGTVLGGIAAAPVLAAEKTKQLYRDASRSASAGIESAKNYLSGGFNSLSATVKSDVESAKRNVKDATNEGLSTLGEGVRYVTGETPSYLNR